MAVINTLNRHTWADQFVLLDHVDLLAQVVCASTCCPVEESVGLETSNQDDPIRDPRRFPSPERRLAFGFRARDGGRLW